MARRAVRLAGLVVAAAALLLGGALALDRVFPPDLARAATASTLVVDREGRLLRAFTTPDGGASVKDVRRSSGRRRRSSSPPA